MSTSELKNLYTVQQILYCKIAKHVSPTIIEVEYGYQTGIFIKGQNRLKKDTVC